jgi:hypothetical protein
MFGGVPAVAEVDMSRIQFVVLGVALMLLIGCRSRNPPADEAEVDPLVGSWEVTSVERDGEPDLLQVGARLTFTAHEVQFQPKAVQIADGTS